jgi:hypothetical protein
MHAQLPTKLIGNRHRYVDGISVSSEAASSKQAARNKNGESAFFQHVSWRHVSVGHSRCSRFSAADATHSSNCILSILVPSGWRRRQQFAVCTLSEKRPSGTSRSIQMVDRGLGAVLARSRTRDGKARIARKCVSRRPGTGSCPTRFGDRALPASCPRIVGSLPLTLQPEATNLAASTQFTNTTSSC